MGHLNLPLYTNVGREREPLVIGHFFTSIPGQCLCGRPLNLSVQIDSLS